jgi:hypothetical protein
MLAHGADKGGRAAPERMTSPLHLALSALDGRPPGSSGKSQLKAPAQFGEKKDIHAHEHGNFKELKC